MRWLPGIWMLGLAWLMTSCGSAPPVADQQPWLVTVEAIHDGHLELPAGGRAADLAPTALRPPVAWLPVEEHVDNASFVVENDPLVGLSLEVLALWYDERRLSVELERQELARRRLDSRLEQEKIVDRRDELQADVAVREALIAASRERDQEELRVAELEVAEAERQLAERRQQLTDIRERFDQGLASAREVDDAVRSLERAEQGVREPAIKLEILQETTGSTTRYQEGIQLAKLQTELGDMSGSREDGGIAHQLAALRQLRETRDKQSSGSLRRMQRHNQRDREVLQDGFVRAPEGGVAVHPDRGLAIGRRVSPAACIFIYKEGVTTIRFPVDERWRDLIQVAGQERPGEGEIDVSIPALGLQHLRGRIDSVVTIDGNPAEGRPRQTLCEAQLLEEVTGLRDGIQVHVRLRIPVPAGAGWLPAWCILDQRQPTVLLADGQERAIKGRLIGEHFLVTSGLGVGDQVRVPAGTEGPEGQRIVGSVRAVDVVQLEGRPWRTTILDMVPDGHHVEAGEVVAHFASSRGDTPDELLAEAEEIESAAATDFAVAQIEAQTKVAKARVAWQKGVLDYRAAAFEHLLARYGSYDQSETSALVWEELKQLDLDEARAELRRKAAVANATNVSRHELRKVERRVRRAELNMQKARLSTVVALRQRPWKQLTNLKYKEFDALDAVSNLRQRLREQRFRFHIDLNRARDHYRRKMHQAKRERRYADALTMRAPVSGQVYRRWNMWMPLRTGDRLHVRHPFFIPTGLERQVEFELPAELYGQHQAGDRLSVRIPLLGDAPVAGRVVAVNETFRLPQGAIDEILIRGSAGIPSKIFSIIVSLDLDDAQARCCTPGVSAWLELP